MSESLFDSFFWLRGATKKQMNAADKKSAMLDGKAMAVQLRKMMDNRAKRSFTKEEIFGICLLLESLAEIIEEKTK